MTINASQFADALFDRLKDYMGFAGFDDSQLGRLKEFSRAIVDGTIEQIKNAYIEGDVNIDVVNNDETGEVGYVDIEILDSLTIKAKSMSVTVDNEKTIDANEVTITATGDISLTANGNIALTASGNITLNAGEDINIESAGNMNVNSAGDMSVNSTGNMSVSSTGSMDVNSDGDMSVTSNSNMDVNSTGSMTVSPTGVFTVVKSGPATPATGPLNCLPKCLFAGPRHGGNAVN